MPMYEYFCESCQTKIELMRPRDSHPERCPECQTTDSLKLLMSLSSFKLQGSGWYQTDYGKKS